MRVMVYRGISGCRPIVCSHKLAWSRQPRLASRISASRYQHAGPVRRTASMMVAVTCYYAAKVTIYSCRT